jgi:hypothetical protein
MTTPVTEEEAVRAFYLAYFACFQRLDTEDTVAYFAPTVFRVARGAVAVLASPAEVRGFLDDLADRLTSRGYGGARTEEIAVAVLDAQTAQVRARGLREDRAGDPLEPFHVLYTLVRPGVGARWLIAGLTSLAV